MAANLFVGINLGQNLNQVVSNTSTNGTDIEIAVDTTKVASRNDLLVALENLEAFIVQQTYP